MTLHLNVLLTQIFLLLPYVLQGRATPRSTHKKTLVSWKEIVSPLHTTVSQLSVLSFSINQHSREIPVFRF